MNRIKKLVQVLLAFMLVACGQSSELSWTEDVKLPDGRVVTLSRWVEFKGPYAMGDTPNESKQWFEFKHPQTGQVVKWENSDELGMLNTLALWIENGNPILLSKPALGGDSRKFQCPNPPYLLYEYASGKWQIKPLAQIPRQRIRANMTTHPKMRREEIEASKRRLSVEQTTNSYTYRDGVERVPYVISFEEMPPQTFVEQNCDRKTDKLLFIEGK